MNTRAFFQVFVSGQIHVNTVSLRRTIKDIVKFSF